MNFLEHFSSSRFSDEIFFITIKEICHALSFSPDTQRSPTLSHTKRTHTHTYPSSTAPNYIPRLYPIERANASGDKLREVEVSGFFSSSLFSLYVIHKKGVLNPLSRRCISTYYEIKKVFLAVHLGSKQPY